MPHIHNAPNRLCAIIVRTVPELNPERQKQIYEAYTEPWRTYHNASHIVHMLGLLNRVKPLDSRSRHLVELMILYHDAWYKVGREHRLNEEMSAQWAYKDTNNIAVAEGIRATATHTFSSLSPNCPEIALLLDLDLWSLGQSWESFARDTEAIWGEYQPIATREEFNRGRAKWAKRFLERPKIYYTPHFEKFESSARANLERLAVSA